MSSLKTWLSNEEVLQGLSEGYVVIGDAPPPVRYEAEDDEVLERFGDGIRTQRGAPCDNQPPDLHGIKNMLRMVQGSDDEDDNDGIFGDQQYTYVVRKPNQLNPNVKEITPNSDQSSYSANNNISETLTKACLKNTNIAAVQTNKHKIIDNKRDLVQLKSNAYKDLAQRLKDEISDTSKSDSFDTTKRKNVAITTLLHLFSRNGDHESATKLITPNFYVNRSTTESNDNSERKSPAKTNVAFRPNRNPNILSSTSNDATNEDIISVKNERVFKTLQNNDETVIKSIAKVNHWLDEPLDKKASHLCVTPIAFKKKEGANSKSPSEQQKTDKAHQPNQYQPSTYAADLGKKYMEKNKIQENQAVNKWEDLHLILKKRDELLIKKAQEQAKNSIRFDGAQRFL